jgi:tripartite ATP-independent transporter DctM subunit
VLTFVLLGFLLLTMANVAIGVAFGAAVTGWLLLKGVPLVILVQKMIASLDSFVLVAIPLFIFSAKLMNTGGISDRISELAMAFVGRLRGGLAHVNIVGSLIFAGMSGSAVADAAGLGAIEIKHAKAAGYRPEFAAALTAASATVGPIMPPSVPMVIYGVLAEASIGALFLGGVVPALLMCVLLMIWVAWVAWREQLPRGASLTPGETARALVRGTGPLLAPLLLVGGMVSGVFTPTEAAVVTVLYCLFLSAACYRELPWRQLPQLMLETVEETGVIAFVLGAAAAMGWVLTTEGLPQMLTQALLPIGSPLLVLLMLNVLLLVLGCVMEAGAILLLLVPVFIPVARQLGIDPVHLGVVMVFNLMIGLCTPPVGLNLFIVSRLAETPIERVTRAILPMLGMLLICLLLITVFPELVLALPRWLLPN